MKPNFAFSRTAFVASITAITAAAFGGGHFAHAQTMDNGLPGPQPMNIGTVFLQEQMLKANLERGGIPVDPPKRKGVKGGAANHTTSASIRPAATTYRATAQGTEHVKAAYIKYANGLSPEAGNAVAANMARLNIGQAWAGLVAPYGLHSGDVADAVTGYYLLNWIIANKQTANPPQAQVLAVRSQFASGMTANPKFANVSNAQKQELSEGLMLNFLYQQKAFSDAVGKNDDALLQKLSDAAASRFQKDIGLDPRNITLGATGLRTVSSR